MLTRRAFLGALGALAPALAASRALAMQEVPGTSMSGDGYRPVALPRKAGVAGPSMSPEARDAVERQIACPCPCTLDVYTCRTSMPCGFSPRIHRDVMGLVENGYSADEILAAFTDVYGNAIRMAPPKRGFDLMAWVAPFAAIGTGALGIYALLRRWQRPAAETPAAGVRPIGVDASADELRRLEQAVREDRR
ncbi:MAG TPA: cytochrome c-type biogenesis protein CcmH [Gemmatimonadaceae bacterium]|nr:cytochrome c-type biogenesis protein CcmH [Gemmatimonadaceae bacterium]